MVVLFHNNVNKRDISQNCALQNYSEISMAAMNPINNNNNNKRMRNFPELLSDYFCKTNL